MSFYDDASLVVIPSAQKTSKLYAVKPTDGSGDLAFTRTGDTATRVNSAGLIEKVRTNLATYSEDFANAAWGKTDITVTANTTANPVDGATTADTLTRTGAIVGFINRQIAQTGIVTFSVFAKAGTTDLVRLNTYDGAVDRGATYNLTTGAITGAYGSPLFTTAQSFGNGWYRISVSVNSATYTRCQIHLDTINSVIVFGAMLETGDIATPYIPTLTAAVSVGPVANVPRLDYLGSTCEKLLLEPQRTNKITYSENQGPTGTLWYPTTTWTVTNNAVVSPSGYQDADTLTENTSTGFHSSYFGGIIESSYTGTYTISAFAKYNGRFFVLSPKGATERTYFNLQTGVVAQLGGGGVTAKIENYGNGWYRCSVTCSFNNENVNFEHMLASAVGTLQYTGNGTSGVHIWGCMAEAGTYATSYIPTLAASATRGADACSKTGISSLIGQTEGTFYHQFSVPVDEAVTRSVVLSNGTTANRVALSVFANALFARVDVGGVNQVNSSATIVPTAMNKVAFRYKANDFAAYVNGVKVITDTSGSTFTAGTLNQIAFVQPDSTSPFNGRTNQVLLFTTALTDAQLAELTTL